MTDVSWFDLSVRQVVKDLLHVPNVRPEGSQIVTGKAEHGVGFPAPESRLHLTEYSVDITAQIVGVVKGEMG
jgi:hypothetical protein